MNESKPKPNILSSRKLRRFIKYGLWITFQFWVFRAPITYYLVQALPKNIDLYLKQVPGYIVADFLAGLTLACAGFFINEYAIWSEK